MYIPDTFVDALIHPGWLKTEQHLIEWLINLFIRNADQWAPAY